MCLAKCSFKNLFDEKGQQRSECASVINIEMKGPFLALLGGSVGTPKIEGNGVRTRFLGGAKTELNTQENIKGKV